MEHKHSGTFCPRGLGEFQLRGLLWNQHGVFFFLFGCVSIQNSSRTCCFLAARSGIALEERVFVEWFYSPKKVVLPTKKSGSTHQKKWFYPPKKSGSTHQKKWFYPPKKVVLPKKKSGSTKKKKWFYPKKKSGSTPKKSGSTQKKKWFYPKKKWFYQKKSGSTPKKVVLPK